MVYGGQIGGGMFGGATGSPDADNVMGVYLPNIYISKITLDSTTVEQDLIVKDPHIGAVKLNPKLNMIDTVYNGADTYKGALLKKWPPVDAPTPTDEIHDVNDNRDLKITVDFAVKDKVKAGSVLSWFLDGEVAKYLKARIVLSTSPDVTKELTLNPTAYFGQNGVFNKGAIPERDLALAAWPSEWAQVVNGNCIGGSKCAQWEDYTKEFMAHPQKPLFGSYLAYQKAQDLYNHVLANSNVPADLDIIDVAADSLTKKTLTDNVLANFTSEEGGNEESFLNSLNKEMDSNGNTIYSFLLRHNFTVAGNVFPDHVAIFACTFLDLEALSNDYQFPDINIPTKIIENLGVGRIVSEMVVNNGSTIKNGHIFFDTSGNLYFGKAHKNPNGQWMKGAVFNVTDYIDKRWDGTGNFEAAYQTEKFKNALLTKKIIPNTKIHDFRYVYEFDKLKLNFAGALEMGLDMSAAINKLKPSQQVTSTGLVVEGDATQTALTAPGNLTYSSWKDTITKKKKANPYFSSMYLASDRSGQCRFHFYLDYYRILRDNSVYPSLFDNLAKIDQHGEFYALLGSAAILKMEIIRRRVMPPSNSGQSSNRLGTPLYPIEEDKNKPPRIIAVSGEDKDTSFRKTVYKEQTTTVVKEVFFGNTKENRSETFKDMGILREFHGDSGIYTYPWPRRFCGIDYDVKDKSTGFYQYGVRLDIHDPTIQFLRGKVTTLSNIISKVNKYYTFASENPDFSNSYSGRFTDVFIKHKGTDKLFNIAYEAFLLFMIYLVNYGGVEKSEIAPTQTLLISFLNPKTTNLRGIEIVLRIMRNFYTKFSSLTRDLVAEKRGFVKTDVTTENPLVPSSTKQEIIQIEHYFDETFDASSNGNYGCDFVSVVNYDTEVTPAGQIVGTSVFDGKKYHDDSGLKIVTKEAYLMRLEKEEKKFPPQAYVDETSTIGEVIQKIQNNINRVNFLSPSFIYHPRTATGVDKSWDPDLPPDVAEHSPRKEFDVLASNAIDSPSFVNNLVLDTLLFNLPDSNSKDFRGLWKNWEMKTAPGHGGQLMSSVHSIYDNWTVDLYGGGSGIKGDGEYKIARAKLINLVNSMGGSVTHYKPASTIIPSAPASIDETKDSEDNIEEAFSYNGLAEFTKSELNPNKFLEAFISIAMLDGVGYKKLMNIYSFSDSPNTSALPRLEKIYEDWKKQSAENTWKNPLYDLPLQEVALLVEQAVLQAPGGQNLGDPEEAAAPLFKNIAKRALFNSKLARVQVWKLDLLLGVEPLVFNSPAIQFPGFNLKAGKWHDLTLGDLAPNPDISSPKLCRITPYSNSTMGAGSGDILGMPTIDEYFILIDDAYVSAVTFPEPPAIVVNKTYKVVTTKKEIKLNLKALLDNSNHNDYVRTNTVFGGQSGDISVEDEFRGKMAPESRK